MTRCKRQTYLNFIDAPSNPRLGLDLGGLHDLLDRLTWLDFAGFGVEHIIRQIPTDYVSQYCITG